MMRVFPSALLLISLSSCLGACAKGSASPQGSANVPSASTPAQPATATSVAPASSGEKPSSAQGEACGELGCRSFESAKSAFEVVLERHPLALGIGEAHAQKGADNVASSTKRFTDELLPELKGKASFLLVELMMPNDSCKKETKQVRKQQEPVTKPQAETNQNEYVVLGTKAKALGIVPDLLRPSCDDLTAITKAGANDVGVMLETIARLTKGVVGSELERNKKAGKDLSVVAYGGALHNDLEPKPEFAKWSYGPALAEKTAQRYIELDLIVPEYIKDTETWTSLAWYSHYSREKLGDRAVLFNPKPNSYVLIFPVTPNQDP